MIHGLSIRLLTDFGKMTFRRFMGFTAMAFLWTGSQIPVYLFGMSSYQLHYTLADYSYVFYRGDSTTHL